MSDFPFSQFLNIQNISEANQPAKAEKKAPTSNECEELKKDLIDILRHTIDSDKLATYFSDGFIISELTNDHIGITVQTNFIKKIIENNYYEQLSTGINELMGKRYEISINCKPATENENQGLTTFTPKRDDLIDQINSQVINHLESGKIKNIDTKKTFENFIVGPSNNLAHAAALAASKNPGTLYPSLYLHGNSGLGKTHLLYAVANRIVSNDPRMRVIMTSANNFMNEMINAIQNKTVTEFRKRYTEMVDVLLIDDVHELKNRPGTQNEFFHIFNDLNAKKKQLIFTSDKHPKEIDGIEDRIKTRLSSCLIIELQQPDLETRIAILKKNALETDIYLPDDVLNLIASSIKSNIRELEGSLVTLGAYSSFFKVDIDINVAKKLLKLEDGDTEKKLTIESISKAVASYLKVPLNDIKGKSRVKNVTQARHLAMYLCYYQIKCTLTEIGDFFGHRDHTTVLHAVDKIKQEIKDNSPISKLLYEIESCL